MSRLDCPSYDGVPTVGGPCWTCQDGHGPCPLDTPIEVCAREGHLPTVGLRHDLLRLAMVADCTRCGAVLMLDQTPQAARE